MKIFFFLLAAIAGLSNPVQSAANTALNKTLGPGLAALLIYGVALIGLMVALPFLGLNGGAAGGKPLMQRFADIPWWAWVGGICNLTFVLAGAIATRKIGSASFTVTTLTCAVCLSLVLDHYGLLGLQQHPASALRIAGGVLAIGGVVLVAMF